MTRFARDPLYRVVMGWTRPRTALMCQNGDVDHHLEKASVALYLTVRMGTIKNCGAIGD